MINICILLLVCLCVACNTSSNEHIDSSNITSTTKLLTESIPLEKNKQLQKELAAIKDSSISVFDNQQINIISIDLDKGLTCDSLITNTLSDIFNTYHANNQKEITSFVSANININGQVMIAEVRIDPSDSFAKKANNYQPLALRFTDEQGFQGHKTLLLDSGGHDPSFLRQKLFHDFLHTQNIPAPNIHFAKVYINQKYIGIYLLKENIDTNFLAKHFKNGKGTLFQGKKDACLDWRGDNSIAYKSFFAKKSSTNTTTDSWSDLIQLIKTLNEYAVKDTQPKQQLDNWINLPNILELMTIGHVWGLNKTFQCENYYLYRPNSQEPFEWLLNDNSSVAYNPGIQMMHRHSITSKLMLLKAIFADKKLKTSYFAAHKAMVKKALDTTKIFQQIDSLAAFLQPHISTLPKKYSANYLQFIDKQEVLRPINYADNYIIYLDKLKISDALRQKYSQAQLTELKQETRDVLLGLGQISGLSFVGLKDFFRQRKVYLENNTY